MYMLFNLENGQVLLTYVKTLGFILFCVIVLSLISLRGEGVTANIFCFDFEVGVD